MDSVLLVAMAAIVVTAMALVVDVLQTRSIRKINLKVEAFQQQDVGASFGDYLLEKNKRDDGSEVTNLEIMASLVGHQIAGSFSMGLKGIASGEARQIASVDRKIMEAVQDPQMKEVVKWLDNAGIPPILTNLGVKRLHEMGLLDKIVKNDGGGQSTSW